MTNEERISALEQQLTGLISALSLQEIAEEPTEYYTSKYSGEEQDAMFDWVNAQMNPTV